MVRGTARTMILGLALTALLGASVPLYAGPSAAPREEPRRAAAPAGEGWRWLAAFWQRIVQESAAARPEPPSAPTGAPDISLGIDPNG